VEVPLERIADPADPRIAGYMNVRDRDADRAGDFICESETVLNVLLSPRSRFLPSSILVAESRIEPLGELLSTARCPVYVAAQAVLDSIVGFHIHRGVLAICARTPLPSAENLLFELSDRCRVVVLVGLANHDNVGGIFRSAAALGADCILLDDETCDPLYRKSIRVSVGGALALPYARVATKDIVPLLKRHKVGAFALAPSATQDLRTLETPRRAALLFGSEGHGLPDSILSACSQISIPMHAFDSLNVSVTAGIALWHFSA
jgi:tRNA G18 (ribose-2'-O)-methylase SpoU